MVSCLGSSIISPHFFLPRDTQHVLGYDNQECFLFPLDIWEISRSSLFLCISRAFVILVREMRFFRFCIRAIFWISQVFCIFLASFAILLTISDKPLTNWPISHAPSVFCNRATDLDLNHFLFYVYTVPHIRRPTKELQEHNAMSSSL